VIWVELPVEPATGRRVKMKKWEEGRNEGTNSERDLAEDVRRKEGGRVMHPHRKFFSVHSCSA
jgi:hypothetical protein